MPGKHKTPAERASKSPLQVRAGTALARYRRRARRPIVVEFAGIPKAGKTSTINQIQTFLRRCGFRVDVVIERASVCPIRDKKHSNLNVWTACTTPAQILEKTQEPPRPDDPEILILDRGIFDAPCWLAMMDRLSRSRTEDRRTVENFLCVTQWRKLVTTVIVMSVSAQEAQERDQGYLPVSTSGSIMNIDVLKQMREIAMDMTDRLKDQFDIHLIDTSSKAGKNGPKKTAGAVVDILLDTIEQHTQEDILNIPNCIVKRVSGNKLTLTSDDAMQLTELLSSQGAFEPREEVEANVSKVQALPVVVVRNRNGDILQLRRKEQDSDNKLHEKIVIGAGAHVRSEDAAGGYPIQACLLREIEEELTQTDRFHAARSFSRRRSTGRS